ncbi:hypothetical protein Glove_232g194 [Diversispora epigaea]|uniref:HTH CENPB-type domain-containing protein n=1 Tax=Diversispora epigaea TaxID=1348612 RepID=A0A397IBD7_9GLOM|nr:hypothetical protein Glove_232g194 [Diversispora epigaea]
MSELNKGPRTILTAGQKCEICMKKQNIPVPSNVKLAFEYSVGAKLPLLEEALWFWTQSALGAEMDLNDRILQRKALQFAETPKIENFKGSLVG